MVAGALRIPIGSGPLEHKRSHRLDRVLDATLPLSVSTAPSLGDAEAQLLADAVRSVGGERFGRYWRSTSTPDSAFSAAAGIEIDAWTQRWLTQVYGSPPPRPRARPGDIVWLAIAASIASIVAARPRERGLA